MATRLDRLLARLAAAEDAVFAELRRLYPEGTQVRVYLSDRQTVPSEAEVFGHKGGRYGCVRVRLLDTPMHLVRDVSYKKIRRA